MMVSWEKPRLLLGNLANSLSKMSIFCPVDCLYIKKHCLNQIPFFSLVIIYIFFSCFNFLVNEKGIYMCSILKQIKDGLDPFPLL